MTRKEWVKENHPEYIDPLAGQGIYGCPDNYEDMPGIKEAKMSDRIICIENCRKCWNEEIEER